MQPQELHYSPVLGVLFLQAPPGKEPEITCSAPSWEKICLEFPSFFICTDPFPSHVYTHLQA